MFLYYACIAHGGQQPIHEIGQKGVGSQQQQMRSRHAGFVASKHKECDDTAEHNSKQNAENHRQVVKIGAVWPRQGTKKSGERAHKFLHNNITRDIILSFFSLTLDPVGVGWQQKKSRRRRGEERKAGEEISEKAKKFLSPCHIGNHLHGVITRFWVSSARKIRKNS